MDSQEKLKYKELLYRTADEEYKTCRTKAKDTAGRIKCGIIYIHYLHFIDRVMTNLQSESLIHKNDHLI